MISDDPNSRPSIDKVAAFIRSHRYDTIDDLKRLSAKDLGINEDLQCIEGSQIASDAKKRANKFMNCPFSRVDIMNSIENLTSYAELSKGTKIISKRVHDQVWKTASKFIFTILGRLIQMLGVRNSQHAASIASRYNKRKCYD